MSWKDILKEELVLIYDDGSSVEGVAGTLTTEDTKDVVALVLDGKIKKLIGKTITIDATDQSLD
ncbi:MAG: hypothetical protein GOVbin4206_57 [Prokaryotic dsDNA virus sp.]|nr:MAG: hypothetical protein GOVbin4206_57 [Prokaryotic dsDNA virus sp.]